MSDSIKAILHNRTTHLKRPYPSDLIDQLTSYTLPGVWHMNAFHRFRNVVKIIDGKKRTVQERVWDGRRHLFNKETHTVPTGLYLAIKSELKEKGFTSHSIDRRESASDWLDKQEFTERDLQRFIVERFPNARDYQVASAVAMIQAANQGGLILEATGTGKTFLVGIVFTVLFDVQCLFVVDELTLLYQAKAELEKVTGEEVGVVGESKYETHRVTVATIQTLWLHRHDSLFKKWLESIGVLVLDELHVQMALRNFDVIEKLQPKAVYGLTATLELKKKHVRLRAYSLCGPVLYEYPIEQGVKDKVLSKVCVVRVVFDKPAEIRKGSVAYVLDYRKHITHSKSRNNLVEKLARLCLQDGKKVILLVEQVNHLHRFGERLADLNPVLVWGGKSSAGRLQALRDFERGKVDLIVANKVFEKGVNVKSVDAGINASAMKSANKAMQALGRFVRLSEGKKYAVYFDISDRGNRFEKAAKQRFKTFTAAGIPVVKVEAPVEQCEVWFSRVLERVKAALEIEEAA